MAARVRVFAQRSFEGALTAPLGIMLLAWVGGQAANWQIAGIWFSAFCCIELLIGRFGYLYQRGGVTAMDIQVQCGHLVFLSFLAGLCWSSAVFVFWVDGQLLHYLMILTILVGVSAVCMLIMSTFLMATIMFYGGVLLPPMVHALLIPNSIGLTIATGLLILYVYMLQYGSQVGMQLVNDLETTVRNELLAERLHLALDAAHQDWFDINPQSGQMITSSKYAKPNGMALDNIHNSLQSWLSLIHLEDRATTEAAFTGSLEMGTARTSEYRIRTSNDAWLWIRSIGHVVDRDAKGNALRIIGIHADITEAKRADDQIKVLAFYDHLTQLPNRRLLNDRLQNAIVSAGHHKQYGALLMLDLDDFKALNDSQGHDVGDTFLIEVARRIESCTRKTDTVARQGGDEFIILLERIGGVDEAAFLAKTIAEKTLEAIGKPYQLEVASAARATYIYNYHCSASIGVTLFSDNSITADELMKRADTAMYQAKASGRNAIRFFDLDMQEAAIARAVLNSELREAVQKNQFVLYYQPQVDESGRITGAEALLRWLHPNLGVVIPDRFIAVTESTGLILPIGRFVMETACAQLVSWAGRPETAQLTLSVNVSAVQFRDHEFMDHAQAIVQSSGIDPHKLKLEITESLLLNDVDDIVEKMFLLKTTGISFSLDDFGTGYSSLAYLKHLPIEQLKIDKSFIRDVLSDANDAAIARTIIALANTMGLGVIAEGVETEGQRQFLVDNGCRAFQGYLYAGPLPLDGFEQYVQQAMATDADDPMPTELPRRYRR